MEAQVANSSIDRPADAAEPRYVGFWARVLAFIIDSIWVGIVLGIVVVAFFGQNYLSAAAAQSGQGSGVLASFLVQLILPAALIIAFWIYKSATPGKMVVGAEIVDAKTLGKPSTGQLIVRYIGYYISSFVLLLGFLWVAFDRRKQGWHDKIAGTLVVKR